MIGIHILYEGKSFDKAKLTCESILKYNKNVKIHLILKTDNLQKDRLNGIRKSKGCDYISFLNAGDEIVNDFYDKVDDVLSKDKDKKCIIGDCIIKINGKYELSSMNKNYHKFIDIVMLYNKYYMSKPLVLDQTIAELIYNVEYIGDFSDARVYLYLMSIGIEPHKIYVKEPSLISKITIKNIDSTKNIMKQLLLDKPILEEYNMIIMYNWLLKSNMIPINNESSFFNTIPFVMKNIVDMVKLDTVLKEANEDAKQ